MNTEFGHEQKIIVPHRWVGTLAVMKHELRLMLFTPLSYLFQFGFLVSLSASIFLIADFYSTDETSLRLQMVFLPWIALIFVPALAMRAWPDEQSDRSVELSMTLPVSIGSVVLGKFLSGFLVLFITLLFTLPMVGTLFFLGKPDIGILFSSYLGAAFTLALFYALGLLASAIIREPISAFVLGLIFLFIILLLGWDIFGKLLSDVISGKLINFLAFFSPYTWLTRMSQGIIEIGSIFYFFTAIFGSLFITKVIVELRYKGLSSVRELYLVSVKCTLSVILFVIAVPILSRFHVALDVTEAGEFTLHKGSVEVIDRLPEKTFVTLFWSESETSVPYQIKAHARRIKSMVRNMASRSKGHLIFHEIDPKPDTNDEIETLVAGIKKIPMTSGDSFFLGLNVVQGARSGVIPYLDVRRERLTEYDITNVLNGLTRKKTPKIGILSPLIRSMSAIANQEGMSFIAELKKSYDIAIIPYFRSSLPDDLDVLIAIDATILQEKMLYSIDQFLVNGGGLIAMMDPYLRFKKTSNAINPEPSEKINDLSDLLAHYGLKYKGNFVIGDNKAASMVADRENQRMSYPFWMRVRDDGLSAAHATTASLNEVFIVEGGAIDILDPSRGQKLIKTSKSSGSLDREIFQSQEARALVPQFKEDQKVRTVAAVLQGALSSAFPTPPNLSTSKSHKIDSTNPSVIFLIADVDWLYDPFSIQKSDMNGNIVVRPLNDNLAFLLNMVEFATGDQSLIDIRSKTRLHRPFDKVTQLFEDAKNQLYEKEKELSKQVIEIEAKIKKFAIDNGTTDPEMMPEKIRKEVIIFRKSLLSARHKLRNVRSEIRREVDQLGQLITVLNILSGPILSGLLAFLMFFSRKKMWI